MGGFFEITYLGITSFIVDSKALVTVACHDREPSSPLQFKV